MATAQFFGMGATVKDINGNKFRLSGKISLSIGI